MTKSFLIKFAIIVFCSLSSPEINAQKTIKVGIYQNFPLVHKDNSGVPSGIFVDLINEIALKENWKIEYVFDTWDQSLENLKDSKLDIITSITYLPERKEFVDYNDEAVITIWGVVCTTKNAPIQDILDLKNKKVAVLKGGVHGINFSKLTERFELNCEFIELDSYDDVMQYVKTNKCDAGVSNNIWTKSNLENFDLVETPILFNPNKLLFAVPKGKNEELIKTIDKHLIAWKTDSRSPYHIILRKWYGDSVIIAYQLPKWVKWGGLLLIFAIGVTLIIAWIFRKLVKSKTKELTLTNIKLQQEIEEREKITKVLHESEEKFKALYNESPDMLVSVSSNDGSILQCNETLLQKTGYLREEVIGAPIFKMYHNDCKEEVKKVFHQFVETGEVSEKELILKTKKGTNINVSLNVKSIRDKTGKILFSISSWRDISI
ncbi:transporter substrate-binding domain-containing protein [Flavobacterium sp. K5-23]|uniref:transporter substrate-binding domain-containing protein n=1 Tax=Flavobacterium sp. K5-23 TaxID=2746225 RepID=UPI00200F607B|nr:transporter substrate-binding domain-containing protein [Flavobacterium sp. K5-23]UQD56691.1 transporter substrate-binding domain-containing protein [Flavobacterium sp. K5-23]